MVGFANLVSGRSKACAIPTAIINSTLIIVVSWFATALAFIMLAAAPTGAQGIAQFSRSYVTPFPKNDQYRLAAFGDSLGDGMWAGLYRAFKPDANVDVIKHSRVSTGFVRNDYFDWNRRIKGILKNQPVQIAVVMVGANDMQAIRHERKWHKIGTDEWRELYGRRVDKFTKSLKSARVAVYWVGLPITRTPKYNENMQVMNEVFREKAYGNGVKFIDTWNGFADQFGRYSAYGPDLSGQIRRLRASDGGHFTMRGYRKLAHFVERVIRGDLKLAKTERNIPLAGSESEQDRAIGRKRKPSEPARDVRRDVREAGEPGSGGARRNGGKTSAAGNQKQETNSEPSDIRHSNPSPKYYGPVRGYSGFQLFAPRRNHCARIGKRPDGIGFDIAV